MYFLILPMLRIEKISTEEKSVYLMFSSLHSDHTITIVTDQSSYEHPMYRICYTKQQSHVHSRQTIFIQDEKTSLRILNK